MQSNGVPLSITIQPYQAGIEYGEDTLVWFPSALDPASYSTTFPFNGADTVYTITISNVNTVAGIQSFNYSVTVFDPAERGADYVPTIISGTKVPFVNESNLYSCTPSANPNATGYQWVASQSTNGNLSDKALDGLTNFMVSPPPAYSIITNPPVGSGQCFHLTHTNPVPQLLQFTETLLPAADTLLKFQSLLGYATTNEVARVQICTNDGVWVDIYTQKGTGGSGQTAFVPHTLSLSNCAGQITSVRFNYDYVGGSYYSQVSANVGWCLENIVMTNASQLVNFATNATVSTNFNFVPAQTGKWVLEARGLIFGQFGLDWSPASQVTAVTPVTINIVQSSPGSLTLMWPQGKLLQSTKLAGPWTTNTAASPHTVAPTNSQMYFKLLEN
jgi:hypothetical protein